MKTIIIEQKEVLEKFHKGLTPKEIEVILGYLSEGKSIYLETLKDGKTIKTWHFYPVEGGQLMSGSDFNNFKKNNYEPD